MKKVVYYNVDDTLDFENQLLKEWGVDDIELIEFKNGEDRDKPEAFLEAVNLGRPVVLDCIIDPNDKVFPMVAPGAAISDIITE